MPQTCSVCKSKRLPEIDGGLVSARPLRNIAQRFHVSPTALCRHRQRHLPEKLALAKQNQDVLSAEHLLAEMDDLKCWLRRGLEQAEEVANPVAFVAFARELRQCLESYFAISERVAERKPRSGEVVLHVVYDDERGGTPIEAKLPL